MIILIEAIANFESLSRNLATMTVGIENAGDLRGALLTLQHECDRILHWAFPEATWPSHIAVRMKPLALAPGTVMDNSCVVSSLAYMLPDIESDQHQRRRRVRGVGDSRLPIDRIFQMLSEYHHHVSRSARENYLDTSDEALVQSEEFHQWLDDRVRRSRLHVDLTGVLAAEQVGRFEVPLDDAEFD